MGFTTGFSGWCDYCEKPIKVGSQFYRNQAEDTLMCTRCKKQQIKQKKQQKGA